MARGAPAQARYTKDQYFELVKKGVLRPDDRVELLEGVVVAMAPHNPGHASGFYRRQARRRGVRDGRGAVTVIQRFGPAPAKCIHSMECIAPTLTTSSMGS